jgi:hypothetical protein
MGALATAAMCVLLGRFDRRRVARASVPRTEGAAYGGVGLLLALAFLTKQNAAPFIFVPVAAIVVLERWRRLAKLGWLALGLAAPLATTVAIYMAAGQLPRAWYFFYEYNRDYAAAGYTNGPLLTVASDACWLGRSYGELLALAAAGAIAVAKGRASRSAAPWLLAAAWTLAGVAAAVAPGKHWDNYLWASHAPVALLGGLGASSMLELFEGTTFSSALKRAGCLGVIALPLVGCVAQLERGRAVLALASDVGGIPPPSVPRRDLAALIDRLTDDRDTIYVTGYAPEMYVLAARRPATRHVVSNFVETVYPGRFEHPSRIAPRFFAELRADLLESRPRVILDACRLGFLCHPTSALTAELPALLTDYHPLLQAPAGVFVRNE